MSKPLCGPAFPCMDSSVINKIGLAATLNLPDGADVHERDRVYIQATAQAAQGMSLRDYFAAKCCASMVSTISNDYDYMRLRKVAEDHDLDSVSQFFAQEAYKQADAMLAARDK